TQGRGRHGPPAGDHGHRRDQRRAGQRSRRGSLPAASDAPSHPTPQPPPNSQSSSAHRRAADRRAVVRTDRSPRGSGARSRVPPAPDVSRQVAMAPLGYPLAALIITTVAAYSADQQRPVRDLVAELASSDAVV